MQGKLSIGIMILMTFIIIYAMNHYHKETRKALALRISVTTTTDKTCHLYSTDTDGNVKCTNYPATNDIYCVNKDPGACPVEPTPTTLLKAPTTQTTTTLQSAPPAAAK